MNFMEKVEWEWLDMAGGLSYKEEIDFITSKVREAVVEYDRLVDVKDYEWEYGSDCPSINETRLDRKDALAEFGIVEKEE